MHTKDIRIPLRECTIFSGEERKEQRQTAWQKIINLKHDVPSPVATYIYVSYFEYLYSKNDK